MKLVLLGTSEFALRCADAMLESGNEICALISMPACALPDNSADVSQFAQAHNIPYHEIEDVNASHSISLIRGYAPDYLFVSWPRLLCRDVLEIPHLYCIGTHPTDLPYNRGRHPLHWLIVLGIRHTKLTFFEMDTGVDAGKVLLQIPFEIMDRDTIGDAAVKMNQAAYIGTKMLCERLRENPRYSGEEQDRSKGNSWRKRTPHDVTLDLRMSANLITRIVKSYAPPYPCAYLLFEKDAVRISDAIIVEPDMAADDLKRLEHGRIIYADKNTITVKADDGVVTLIAKNAFPETLLSARYIHPPSCYLLKWPGAFADWLG